MSVVSHLRDDENEKIIDIKIEINGFIDKNYKNLINSNKIKRKNSFHIKIKK
jgi:hypothetical protein